MATTPFLGSRTSALPTQHGTAVVLRAGRARRTRGSPLFTVASYLKALRADRDPQARLRDGVRLLPALVDGCHHASVTTVAGGRIEVRAASDATSRRADELQEERGEGPCLQAVRTGHSVVSPDLSTESRWLGWCSAAAGELPVASVLSVLLIATPLPLATLDLYSDTVHGLSGVDIGLLHTLAAPLAGALLDGRIDLHLLGPAA